MTTIKLTGLVVGVAVFAGVVASVAARQGQAILEAYQVTLAPGLPPVPDYNKMPPVALPAPKVPEGFTPLFDGQDLSGWHISKTARHGVTPDFHAAYGMILGTQQPIGGGGLLLTDKNYRNFEIYMEVNPDWGCDSGIFFRSTENGAAYQITLDYLQGGSMGRLIGEGGIQVGRAAGAPARGAGAATGGASGATPATGAATPTDAAASTGRGAAPPAVLTPGGGRGLPSRDPGMNAWKREEWNTVRARVTGDVPHVTVWINDEQMSDTTDTANHAVGGMVEGPIALQIHGGPVRWQPGGFWRWRNVAIKALPN
jgi:hypothetical protein